MPLVDFFYAALADLLVILHFLFIVFVLFGALLLLRWAWLVWPHLVAVGWAVYIELSGGFCPLTPLEYRLRRLAGEAGYEESFIQHYLGKIIYPGEITPNFNLVLALVVIVFNLILYGWVFLRRRSK